MIKKDPPKIDPDKATVYVGGKMVHRGDGVKVDIKKEPRKTKKNQVRNG